MADSSGVKESVELCNISRELANSSIEKALAEVSVRIQFPQAIAESSSQYVDQPDENAKLLNNPLMESVSVQVDMGDLPSDTLADNNVFKQNINTIEAQQPSVRVKVGITVVAALVMIFCLAMLFLRN